MRGSIMPSSQLVLRERWELYKLHHKESSSLDAKYKSDRFSNCSTGLPVYRYLVVRCFMLQYSL